MRGRSGPEPPPVAAVSVAPGGGGDESRAALRCEFLGSRFLRRLRSAEDAAARGPGVGSGGDVPGISLRGIGGGVRSG